MWDSRPTPAGAFSCQTEHCRMVTLLSESPTVDSETYLDGIGERSACLWIPLLINIDALQLAAYATEPARSPCFTARTEVAPVQGFQTTTPLTVHLLEWQVACAISGTDASSGNSRRKRRGSWP
jgi:hypothetical protein